MGNLTKRILTALVLLPIVFLVIWQPDLDLAFVLLVAALGSIGLLEYYHLAGLRERSRQARLGVAAGVGIMTSAYFGSLLLTNFALCVGLIVVTLAHARNEKDLYHSLTAPAFGLLYVAWTAAHFVLLHGTEGRGPALVTFVIGVVALSDSGAYFAGKAIGSRKLAPVVSPNKTWEGAAGAVCAAMVGACIFYYLRSWAPFAGLPAFGIFWYLGLGAVLSVVGQLGDLAESALKRAAGEKDSGSVLPGHGGVLDRCDGFLLAGPILYYIDRLALEF